MVFRVDYDKLRNQVRITLNNENAVDYEDIETIAEVAEVLESYIKHEM